MRINIRSSLVAFLIIGFWSIVSSASTVQYLYDANGRLAQADYTTKSIIYTYDMAGNLLRREIIDGGSQNNDTDGDGIDDNWELIYFPNLDTADQFSDFDGDGYTDLQEYLNQQAKEKDRLDQEFDPTIKNAPGGTGYYHSFNFLIFMPAILGAGN